MNTRIETIGDATLYLGDCMDILPTLDKVDAVITDPPYGLNIAAQPFKHQRMNGAEKKNWDESAPTANLLDEIIKLGDKAILWGGNYFNLPPSRCWLVWDKQNAVPTMSDCEIAWTNLDANTKRFSHPVGRVLNGHPSEKPLRLMEWTLQTVKASGVILDPFMGSGTTGVASLKTNNKFIGIERDPKYFNIACKRIEQATKQVDMFIEQPKQEQTSLL